MPITDSPLRYPGGKTQMKKFVVDLLNHLSLHENIIYVEPFAGGAGVAISLLYSKYVSKIHINDLDPAIFCFWYSLLNYTDEFIDMTEKVPITMTEWEYQKDIQSNKDKYSTLEIGFSTFFLNRTNVSGIISGGPIGGKKQNSKYKLDCRFNKKNLIKKIERLALNANNITVTNYDAAEFIQNGIKSMNPRESFIFFDPPYYNQGRNLYSNYYNHDDHVKLASLITSLEEYYWITTYDYSSEIVNIYKNENKRMYRLNYSAKNVRKAEELLFFSKMVTLPSSNNIFFI